MNPHEDRLSFSVIWNFTADGQLIPDTSSGGGGSRSGGGGEGHTAPHVRGEPVSSSMGSISGGGAVWIGGCSAVQLSKISKTYKLNYKKYVKYVKCVKHIEYIIY